MANSPILRLDLVDVYGRPLGENVDVILKHTVLSEFVRTTINASGPVDITGLQGAMSGPYKIEIDAASFQISSWFINLKPSGITSVRHAFAVDPKKVVGIQSPAYSALPGDLKNLLSQSGQVLGYENLTGKSLYDSLSNDPVRTAGLLNIVAKCRATPLGGGKTVLPSVMELLEIRGDRFFARVPKTLRDDTKNAVQAGLFTSVDSSLHTPAPGFKPAGSFKTLDHYGNLQLTFSMNTVGECRADIDIDDANGIEHIFQVLHNAISGEPTNPYNIHEILVGYQTIDPGYKLKLR